MKILHVWDGDYPWDIRVDKISRTLTMEGHSVYVACRNTTRQIKYTTYNGYHVKRMRFLPRIFGKLNEIISFPAFFNPAWLLHIYFSCKNLKCELIICRDLPLAPAAIFIARLFKIPCILDMAECYPELLRCIWTYEKPKFINIFIRNPLIADIVERAVISRIDRIFVMVEESKERLINKGVDQQKIDIISNTPVLSRFFISNNYEKKGSLKIVYVGLLNPSRGIDTTLKALSKYVIFDDKIHLTVVGSGKAENELKQLVIELNLSKFVTFTGWVDNALVPKIIAESDVGIVPHHKCGHWDTTIPNKLFDYMAAGKPVIVSNATPIARIVEKEAAGIVYKDFDENDLVNALIKMKDFNYCKRLGWSGRRAIESTYNWESESNHLIDSIGKIMQVRE
jgi:glycosyltransferase involved in cell wall biosynthesis